MGEHTPTPWTANPDGWQPWQGAIQIVGADGYVVAYTATGGPEKENADLLIKAASCHDALVKALEDLNGAMRFVLAFYEPGQRYLDTNAWKSAEAGARDAHQKATAILAREALAKAATL